MIMNAGQKRKRNDCDGSEELSTILAKFIVTEECDTNRRLAEAEMEEKQREQERKHEEGMTDDGLYAVNCGIPSYSLAAPQSFSVSIFSFAILPLHSRPWFSTFQSHLSWSFLLPPQIQLSHPPTMTMMVAIKVLLILKYLTLICNG